MLVTGSYDVLLSCYYIYNVGRWELLLSLLLLMSPFGQGYLMGAGILCVCATQENRAEGCWHTTYVCATQENKVEGCWYTTYVRDASE